MAAYLLDTNAVSDLMRGDARIRQRIAACRGTLSTSVIVVGEIRYGLERLTPGPNRKKLQTKARRALAALRIRPLTRRIAEVYGQTKRTIETTSTALEDNDIWIAATAISSGAVLVSRDSDFHRVSGLVVEDWTH
jgi:tRNA(fMet)-specific endonuclease VapC